MRDAVVIVLAVVGGLAESGGVILAIIELNRASARAQSRKPTTWADVQDLHLQESETLGAVRGTRVAAAALLLFGIACTTAAGVLSALK